jgi:hypothetical protein
LWIVIGDMKLNKIFYGILFNQPFEDFGINAGDEVFVFLYQSDWEQFYFEMQD